MGKKTMAVLAVITAVVTIALISIEAYYITIALVVGALLMLHREVASLIRIRRPPVFDERVRDNIGRSVRNSFIFLVLAIVLLMLPFGTGLVEGVETVHMLGGLFVSAGAVYLLSYLHYDLVEPKLTGCWRKLFRISLLAAGISLAVFIISVFLHNAVYGLFKVWFGEGFWEGIGMPDEPVFFFIALIALVTLAAGTIGSIVLFIAGLVKKSPELK
jgi:hypothetical protein